MNLPKLPGGIFYYPVGFKHSADLSANDSLWAVRNPAGSGKRIRIRALRGSLNYDGTATAATNVAYDVVRFSGANPSGENAGNVVKAHTGNAEATILTSTSFRQSGGGTALTVAGITFETVGFDRIAIPISATGVVVPLDRKYDQGNGGLILLPGEGVAIRLVVAGKIGVAMNGHFEAAEEILS